VLRALRPDCNVEFRASAYTLYVQRVRESAGAVTAAAPRMLSRPAVKRCDGVPARHRSAVFALLGDEQGDGGPVDDRTGVEHERQHQELMLTEPAECSRRPSLKPSLSAKRIGRCEHRAVAQTPP